jgi:hypothetical protein
MNSLLIDGACCAWSVVEMSKKTAKAKSTKGGKVPPHDDATKDEATETVKNKESAVLASPPAAKALKSKSTMKKRIVSVQNKDGNATDVELDVVRKRHLYVATLNKWTEGVDAVEIEFKLLIHGKLHPHTHM